MTTTTIAAFAQTLASVGATKDPNSSVITAQFLASFTSGVGTPWASAHDPTAGVPNNGGEPIWYSPPGTPLVAINTPWQPGYPTSLAIPAAAAVGRPTTAEGPGNSDFGLTVIGTDAEGNWTWMADFEQALPNVTPNPTKWSWTQIGYTANVATFNGQWSPLGSGELASGLSVGGLAILQSEVEAGVIPHMIGITVADIPTGTVGCTYGPQVLPATEHDSSMPTTSALVPRYGQIYSFPAGMAKPTNLSCPYAEMLFTAIQDYGAVLLNRDGDYVTVGFAEIPQAGATDHITAALDGVEPYSAINGPTFPWSDLILMAAPTTWPRTTVVTPPPPPPPPPVVTIPTTPPAPILSTPVTTVITVGAVAGATGYTVYRNGTAIDTLTSPGTVTDEASALGDIYTVTATNSAGTSPQSPSSTV
jgi:hypothetical protein